MKKFKALSVLALLILSAVAVAIPAYADNTAVPVEITDVLVNGHSVSDFTDENGDSKRIRLDDKLDIEVMLRANERDTKLSVEAALKGDKYKTSEESEIFTLDAGDNDVAELSLDVSKKMKAGKYALRIEVDNDAGETIREDYFLNIQPESHRVDIKDVIFSPANEVKAGYTLITNVKVKNYGEYDEDDVKITISIPELGRAAEDSVYLDVEEGKSKTTEDLWFRIPSDSEDGTYDVDVTVLFDDDREFTETYQIDVVEGKTSSESAGKTIIAISKEAQNLAAGGDAVIYPITVSNTGDASKTYTISVNAGEWATAQATPNMFVLDSGETKIVYVSVGANKDATAGAQVFGVAITAGDKTEEITMNANVLETKKSLKNGLEIALIVLVVILILVALIVGFSRLKKDDEDEEQTYY